MHPLRLNETCTDLELGEICTSHCADEISKCMAECPPGDVSCENICIRDGFTCVDGCPCNIDCPTGCQDCPAFVCSACFSPENNEDHVNCIEFFGNELSKCTKNCENELFRSLCQDQCDQEYFINIETCPCEPGCPDGCPCPNYECEESSLEKHGAVLVLKRFRIPRKPVLVNFESFTTDLSVSWYNNGPENHQYYPLDGCSVLYKDKNYLFGGYTANINGTLISYGPHILDGCDIVKAEGVSFYHDCDLGSVGYLPTVDDKEAYIMLYDGEMNNVQAYDGHAILEAEFWAPNKYHSNTGGHIPIYKEKPILIGGMSENSVETFSLKNEWTEHEDLVFPDGDIESYTTVWGDFGVVVFPGKSRSNEKIWRLFDDKWTNIGIVAGEKTRRAARSVLFPNNEVMMIGGYDNQQFIKYAFNDDFTSIKGEILEDLPFLAEYDFPYAIYVENNFCTI
ncbi:Oidioi.mRNA.OKI2018_I69.chr1.g58.t1.cds [Oikopleura dioica]|uniref:Oidioi.mRNA.OKI2018_I69.chr1.g58.t1.cds n=1 Tax=Oikopleura dioica TaxID=34765 RepID=A0ABN7SMH5_OIKDI|nr:Oidioi.mRNA.OKI2018_I69.chr1.g58.t1.cds [Oikopleura dioica]